MIDQMVKRIVLRLFPELTAKLHLPHWAVIEKIYQVTAAATSTPDRPQYCADLQVLKANGKPDLNMPKLQKVPLPATAAGQSRGIYAYPKKGTIVELAFILGHPDKPFIRSILVQGAAVPALGLTEVLISRDADNYYRMTDADGITERCEAIADRVAKARQRLKVENGGKLWVGNETDNVLKLLSDLMGQVISIANALAAHSHSGVMTGGGSTSTPNNASSYSAASSATAELKDKLDTQTE